MQTLLVFKVSEAIKAALQWQLSTDLSQGLINIDTAAVSKQAFKLKQIPVYVKSVDTPERSKTRRRTQKRIQQSNCKIPKALL
jgi:hypothetical protein